ncbi:flippase, partial [Patescibacteria group bacterium]|nr:flippase [Patescibacteria group bacterium]
MKDKLKNFFLKNRSISQTVAKNTFWLFTGEIFAKTFRAAIVIYAARVLGVGSYGVFSYAITLASFFTIFSDIGLNAILNRETVRQPELRERYASTTLFIKLFLILIGVGLIFGFAPAFTKIQGVGFLLPGVAALFIFDSLREFGYSLNRAMEKMEREAFNRFFTNFSIAGLGLYFLIVAPSPKTLMAAYAIGSGLGALIIIWTLREYFKNPFLNFTAKLVRPIFSAAWPFALMGLLSVIMINTDTIMLGWLKTAADIGLYSAAQRPVQLLYIIPTLISAASFPALARLAQRDNKRFREAFEKIIVFILLFALPITLIGLIFGKEIMGLLFGQSYLPATLAFQLLMITVLISFPATFISNG